MDLVAHLEHEGHVVLDEHDGHALGGQLAQQGAERRGLAFVESRRRLVEQEDVRLGRQGTRQLDEPGLAGRELVGPDVGQVRRRPPARAAPGRRRVGWRDGGGPRPTRTLAMGRERTEQLETLERAGQPEARPPVGALGGDVGAAQQDPTPGRPLQPGS